MRWFEVGGSWHIVVEPAPLDYVATLVCGFNPPTLTVDRMSRRKVPWRAVKCIVCVTAHEMGLRIKSWEPV